MIQHPADIRCKLCKQTLRRQGHFYDKIVYACLCGGTVREIPRTQATGTQRKYQPPNDAA